MDSNDVSIKPWTTKSQDIVLDTPRFKIRKRVMMTGAGVETDYWIHEALDSVICVCVDKDGRVLVERQYRAPIERVSVDFPAGRMEQSDADAEAGIRRELREELGYHVHKIQKLGVLDKDPGLSSSRLHVFMAEGAISDKTNRDSTENISSQFVTPVEILRMINDGDMACAFCVASTMLAFRKLGWLTPNLAH